MSLLTAELINEIELDRDAALDRVIATELENRALKRRLSELEERSPFVPADRH
jgi:tetrahydromethanopterin S-methyltransferase subunit G